MTEYFTCPITLCVFRHPVTMSDGYTYEYSAIYEWMNKQTTSPMTKQIIDKKFTINYMIKNLIDDHNIKSVIENRFPEYDIINESNITKKDTFNFYFFQNLYLNDQKIYLDNISDLECVDNHNRKPIHRICKFSEPEIIKYIIDKGVNLECQTDQKIKPIHLICKNSTPEMIKYIIDKGVDLECMTDQKIKPIHLICQNSTPEMIKYIIDKGVDLECVDDDNWKPIHYICRRSTPEMIKYIIDKGVDLESRTGDDRLRPIHLICQHSTPEMIKYIIDKGVDLESRTDSGLTPIQLICKYSTLRMMWYIINTIYQKHYFFNPIIFLEKQAMFIRVFCNIKLFNNT